MVIGSRKSPEHDSIDVNLSLKGKTRSRYSSSLSRDQAAIFPCYNKERARSQVTARPVSLS
jgi:hypothetical protein